MRIGSVARQLKAASAACRAQLFIRLAARYREVVVCVTRRDQCVAHEASFLHLARGVARGHHVPWRVVRLVQLMCRVPRLAQLRRRQPTDLEVRCRVARGPQVGRCVSTSDLLRRCEARSETRINTTWCAGFALAMSFLRSSGNSFTAPVRRTLFASATTVT